MIVTSLVSGMVNITVASSQLAQLHKDWKQGETAWLCAKVFTSN